MIRQRPQHRKPNPCWAPVGPRETETLGKTAVPLNTHYLLIPGRVLKDDVADLFFHMLRNKHDNNVEVIEEVKAVELKNSPGVPEVRNGPQKVLTRTPSPREIPENPHAERAANPTADAAQADAPECTLIQPEGTLIQPEGERASAHSSAAEAEAPPSAAEDLPPDTDAPSAPAACAENHTEINLIQHVDLAAPDDDDDDDDGGGDGAEACGQAPGVTHVLSQPDTQLPPVVVNQEEGEIAPSW